MGSRRKAPKRCAEALRHSLSSANALLKEKGLSKFLEIIHLDYQNNLATVRDVGYGDYQVSIKSLYPKSSMPLCNGRKRENRLNELKNQYLNKLINNLKIIDIFYGPDRGYKNRSFYFEYTGNCGHQLLDTLAVLLKYKKRYTCQQCQPIKHGERQKVEGKLKKRTSTYIYWVSHHKKLPKKYHSFEAFKKEFGEKPHSRAKLELINNQYVWVNAIVSEDKDLILIESALRRNFRNSEIFKNALKMARVETEKGPRYRCASCKNLFKRTEVQIDHIEPIKDLDGKTLTKDNIIHRVWTDKIQVLDKVCHSFKSKAENKIRRENKKLKEKK